MTTTDDAIYAVRDAIRELAAPEQAGDELGAAELGGMFSSISSKPEDIPGLTVSFMAGRRPVEARLTCDFTNSGAGTGTAHLLVGGVVRGRLQQTGGNDQWHTHFKSGRADDLSPGVLYVAKVQLSSSSSASWARIGGDATNLVRLSVVTL